MHALNIQVAIEHARRGPSAVGGSATKEVFTRVQKELQQQLNQHTAQMRQELETLWSGERADLEKHREQVRKLLKLVNGLRRWQQTIQQFRATEWGTWTAFVTEVLLRDRELLPESAKTLRQFLADLDAFRTGMVDLAAVDNPQQRSQLATTLRRIASQIESGGLSP
jgi:hypothetical protein